MAPLRSRPAAGMKGEQTNRRRGGRRLFAAAAILVLALALPLLIVQVDRMKHREEIEQYLASSTAFCRIPELDSGFIPQGLSYDPASNSVLLTGYYGRGGNSPIYVIDRQTGSAKKILMQTEDGGAFRGHAGGLSIYGGQVYIAGSTAGCMYAYPLEALLGAEDGGLQNASAKIALKTADDFIRVSFTSENGDLLYGGEFHKAPLFYTHASHAVETKDGRQSAYLFGFTVNGENAAVPQVVYAIPDKVQGACFDGGYLYLSQTDGLLSARILSYRLDELTPAGTKSVLGVEVPLYILSESGAVKSTRIPPMSEEIYVVDGKLLILYESASNRYRIGRKLGLDQVLATPVEFFR